MKFFYEGVAVAIMLVGIALGFALLVWIVEMIVSSWKLR
jgi:hypothetical protein